MWFPDSLQISRALIQAELDGQVPAGTIAAVAAFSMNATTKEEAKETAIRYSLNPVAAKIAWRFLGTGQIVIENGVLVNALPVVESHGTPVQNHPIENSDSDTGDEPVNAFYLVREKFRKYFPDWVDPTTDQCISLMQKAREIEVLDDVLFNLANSGKEIKNPITLALWVLNNKTHEQIRQERDITEKKGRTGDSIVIEAMRKAEAMIPTLPTPAATPETVDLLQQLKEKVQSGRT